jgi:Flp pilus assembly protein TadB
LHIYRSIIEKSFPEQIKARKRSQKKTSDHQKILKEFEEHGKKDGSQTGSLSEEQMKMFIGGAILVLAAVVIVVLIVSILWSNPSACCCCNCCINFKYFQGVSQKKSFVR